MKSSYGPIKLVADDGTGEYEEDDERPGGYFGHIAGCVNLDI